MIRQEGNKVTKVYRDLCKLGQAGKPAIQDTYTRPFSADEAARVPLASLAAYQSLFNLGQAQAGERVLIIGAGGAVDVTAVQLAKNLGAEVYAVNIAEKAGVINQFGPHQSIDEPGERYENGSGNMDLVLDFAGGENLQLKNPPV